jgi:acyl-CoA synthetase (AMP-forming)/AMP-acid ligase II
VIWYLLGCILFISGGENIQPEEIELILRNFPGIFDAMVVPIENP